LLLGHRASHRRPCPGLAAVADRRPSLTGSIAHPQNRCIHTRRPRGAAGPEVLPRHSNPPRPLQRMRAQHVGDLWQARAAAASEVTRQMRCVVSYVPLCAVNHPSIAKEPNLTCLLCGCFGPAGWVCASARVGLVGEPIADPPNLSSSHHHGASASACPCMWAHGRMDGVCGWGVFIGRTVMQHQYLTQCKFGQRAE